MFILRIYSYTLDAFREIDYYMCLWIFVLQVTIWWAGLMRGAVSMALAYNQVKDQIISFNMEHWTTS